MKHLTAQRLLTTGVALGVLAAVGLQPARADSGTYNTNTLAGKVAAVNSTAGLAIRMSAFVQQEASSSAGDVLAADGATLSAGPSSIQPPDVTVNQDTAGAPQNETSIAVDPNNPQRVVGSANDYVTRTWSCTVNGTPCSSLGDGYSGTYYSNNGGSSWCCLATDPQHLGSLIPGVTNLAGGTYDAGGDPAVAFDASGNVYYAGLGFDRYSAPNTVAVNKGTFSKNGQLTWSQPTFIDQTTSPSVFNDKEWIAADSNATSPYANRVYVTFTRFIFDPATGAYVQSPIFTAHSTDGGQTFSTPASVSGNVLYGQGSRPVVGPDGTVYIFWDGSTRLASLDSTYMVKSTDGGVTWSSPVAIAPVADSMPLADTVFRVNSFPAAAVAPDGTLYVSWSSEIPRPATVGGTPSYPSYAADQACADWLAGSSSVSANCYSATAFSTSSDGGSTWSTPQVVLSATRTAVGYPIKQPQKNCETYDSSGNLVACSGTLEAPAATSVESMYPSVTVGSNGDAYVGAYVGDVVAPWQSCTQYESSVNCTIDGPYINNSKLDYVVQNVTSGAKQAFTALPINTRYQFRGQFIGDYTQIAAGSNGTIHALWTDTNNQQKVAWWYGEDYNPALTVSQQDVVTATYPNF